MKIENEALFVNSIRTGISLFLGAGFSVDAENHKDVSLPIGNTLKELLVKRFSKEPLKNLSLPEVCQIITNEKEEEFHEFIRETYTIKKFDKAYYSINNLKLKSIYTTNIDNLIEKIFEPSENYYINDAFKYGASFSDRNSIDYFPLHGSVTNPNRSFVFSSTSISGAIIDSNNVWQSFIKDLTSTPFLFWGNKLQDGGTLASFNEYLSRAGNEKPKWILLLKEDQGLEEYFRSLGFQIIIGDTNSLLKFISSVNPSETVVTKNQFQTFFKDAPRIPSRGQTPVRPIENFFKGDSPVWEDIYSGNIKELSHFNTVVDSTLKHRATGIVGVPGCGKTTLLMQIAVSLDTPLPKSYIDNLTLEKSQIIASNIKENEAFIFIDDISSSIEGVNFLIENSKCNFVFSEREYNYDIISHFLPKKDVNIINISNITPADQQSIFNSIPQSIKSNKIKTPHMEGDGSFSLFDFVDLNVRGAQLSQRMEQQLKKIRDNDKDLYFAFLQSCYVHACGCPVSLDMMFSLYERNITHTEVYNEIDKLGKFLTEWVQGTKIADDDQDYYVPRSRRLAEIVIDTINSKDLRHSLLHFHNNVASIRIHLLKNFLRRAFDAVYALKAFPHWEDGKEYFEMLHEKYDNPFVWQQGALYLHKKNKNSESFAWIERALNDTRKSVPSIRHTHAVILFNANINKEDTHYNKEKLEEAISVIKDCYKYDKRKLYHAKTFADFSIKYYQKYPNNNAVEYLKEARKWTNEEEKSSPWSRDLRYWQRKINRFCADIGI